MPWNWHVQSSCILLIWLCTSGAICPSNCLCSLDKEGRRLTSCLKGGMMDHLPVNDMDIGMEILDISAPEDNWNFLAIGPVFQKFKVLEEVRIKRSNIAQIGMHTFWGVPSLKVLDLTFNNITAVFDHNFRGLVNLEELSLDDNLIERLPSGVFKHLTELRVLTLQRNRFEELVPRLFLKLGKLQVLKLNGNKINEIVPELFKDILELRKLECRACGITRINTQIYHLLPYLTHLDLGNNQIQFIAADEFLDLRRIRTLRLDGNMLPVVLEKTFVNQPELRTLCLARNRLAKVTNTAFLNLTNLYELDISYNKLNRVEGVAFRPVAHSLRKLAVGGNQLPVEDLRVVLQATVKLNEVHLADMRISELPRGLLPDNLRAVNLSGNNLSALEVRVLPRQLVELDISRNRFEGFGDKEVIVRLERLGDGLYMEDNPWSCDLCHMEATQALLDAANKSSAFWNVTCTSPLRLKDLPLGLLHISNFTKCGGEDGTTKRSNFYVFVETNSTLVIGGLGLFLFLVACVTFVVYSCLQRKAHNAREAEKRIAAERQTTTAILENPPAIFGDKDEISFKFALDLTERKVSVSTIDEIKRDTQLHTLPNGNAIGI